MTRRPGASKKAQFWIEAMVTHYAPKNAVMVNVAPVRAIAKPVRCSPIPRAIIVSAEPASYAMRNDENGRSSDVYIIRWPCKLMNPLNSSQGMTRGATFAASSRKKQQRTEARLRVTMATVPGLSGPFRIELVRIAPGRFDDDNLRAAFKSIRDGVADALGFRDDSDPRLEWHYRQETGRRMNRARGVLAQHEVRVAITIRGGSI